MALPLWAALADPAKYAEWVPIEKVFAAGTIDETKVQKFVILLMKGKTFKPLVGVVSPIGDKIAVADGHHRFHAFQRIGHSQVLMAVSNDYAWYPIVALGINQLTSSWHTRVRRPLKKLRYKLFGGEDWGV